MKWIGALLGLAGLGIAGFGLAFFLDDMVAGLGRDAAMTLRPDHRLMSSLIAITLIGAAAGLHLRQVGEASHYLMSLLALIIAGAACLLGVANWVFFEPLYAETRWLPRTGDNVLGVVPETLGGLVGVSSGEEGALRVAAGLVKGLGRTLVDMVRHPGFETIPDGPLTLIVSLPLFFAFIVFNIGVAPRISAQFHAGQPLWLRVSAQFSLFAATALVVTAAYLNLLVRQSVNFAGSLAAG